MAFTATTVFEVRSGGADGTTGNGGAFDPGATFATDGAVSSANTASPVFSSASYNFQARDVGAWLFIKSGTNTIPGWYQIASVASNQATLTAGAGTGVLYPTYGATTATGCGTAASLSTVTWGVDYSQQTAAGITYTDMVIQATTTQYQSAGNPVGPNVVGNSIAVSSGTNFTVQRVTIASVSGTTATCDKSLGTAAASGGHGILGGCLATPGQASALMVSGNDVWIRAATYSITSASTNVASGCLSLPGGTTAAMTRAVGYNALRGDNGTKPLLQASGIATFTLVTGSTAGVEINNLSLDGASLTSSQGIKTVGGNDRVVRCKIVNCTNNAINFTANAGNYAILCEATGCSTQTVYTGGNYLGCVAHDNTVTGFTPNTSTLVGCISANNSGATSDGYTASAASLFINCLAYNNGRHGFNFTAGSLSITCVNCLATDHTAASAVGFTANTTFDGLTLYNCAGFNNNAGNVSANIVNSIGFVTLTTTPYTNAAGNDFSLNNNAGAGAACRAAGMPATTGNYALPFLATSSNPDIGAIQHAGNPAPIVIGS